MSAAVLREAAALMRERAGDTTPGPWVVDVSGYAVRGNSRRNWVAETVASQEPVGDAAHIASWHPAVALAVADLLDRAADDHDETPCPAMDAALAVANAYLGTDP